MRIYLSPGCFAEFFDKLVHPSMVGDNFETYVQIMENLFASKKTE